MDEKEFKDLISKADKKLEAIEKSMENKVGAEQLKTIQDSLESLNDKMISIENIKFGDKEINIVQSIKNLQEHINKLEKETKARLFDFGQKPIILKDKVGNMIKSEDWKNHIKMLQTEKTGKVFVLEKAANDLLTSDWTADTGAVGLPQLRLSGVTAHPWKDTPVFASVPKRTVGMEHQITYTEELTRDDQAAVKAEGSQYSQSGATWISRILSWFDIGCFVKVSREDLEDAEYMNDVINDLLRNGLLRKVEYDLVNGAGTTEIEGVYTAAKTFAKVLGSKAVSTPSMRDIIGHARLFVRKGYNAIAANDANKTGYRANLALLGPAASYAVTTEKDEIGRPLVDNLDTYRPFGLTIAESEDLTESETSKTFVVGDFKKAMLYLKRNLIIETGYDGNDFTYGYRTVRASIRGNLLIKNLEKYAFVKGDFETAGALIEV